VRQWSHRVIAGVTIGVILGAALVGGATVYTRSLKADAVVPAPGIDQEAVSALESMGKYLRTLNTFQVHAIVTTEEVLPNGEKVQLGNVSDLLARRPNGLRLDVTSDLQERNFRYDGKTFTLFAPRSGYYASVPAPPTIGELADKLEADYGIELPFVDLFRWGTPAANVADLTGATDMGPSEVDGVTCEHYGFRQKGLDWQVWIQQGDFPLPRKLVITTLTDEARPQNVSLYTWNLAPSLDNSAFTFVPPKDARKIDFASVKLKGHALKTEEKTQ
jgi:hypothetical protein